MVCNLHINHTSDTLATFGHYRKNDINDDIVQTNAAYYRHFHLHLSLALWTARYSDNDDVRLGWLSLMREVFDRDFISIVFGTLMLMRHIDNLMSVIGPICIRR